MKELCRKYRHALPLLIYGIVYLAWFSHLEKTVTRGYTVIHVALDDYIPFCEVFVVPYFLWFAYVAFVVMYFFFKDKEDLFAALVEKPLKQLYLTMEEHYAAEMRSETQVVRLEQNDDDLETSREIIRQMYANRDAFLLLLTKSQGSRFENCLDEIVDISEQQYRRLCDMVTGATGRPRIDDYMTHWMAHIMVDTFMHLFLHESEESMALKHVDALTRYLARGWMGMMTES